jgi:hypothetical protein
MKFFKVMIKARGAAYLCSLGYFKTLVVIILGMIAIILSVPAFYLTANVILPWYIFIATALNILVLILLCLYCLETAFKILNDRFRKEDRL